VECLPDGEREKSTRSICVNQVEITFTRKPITAWGGIAAIAGKFLEGICFQEWVEKNIPIRETSQLRREKANLRVAEA